MPWSQWENIGLLLIERVDRSVYSSLVTPKNVGSGGRVAVVIFVTPKELRMWLLQQIERVSWELLSKFRRVSNVAAAKQS